MNRDRARFLGIIGLLGCAAGLFLAPRDALIAWLVAWLAWGSIPIGSLALLMLVALIPGKWRAFYIPPLTVGTSLVPLVAIAAIPLLVSTTTIYPWTDAAVGGAFTGFKGAWLSTSFFVIRSIIYLLVLTLFAWAMLEAGDKHRSVIAAVGVILYALIGSLIGIDFAESTEPEFHSSIYGLLALTNQWLAGISFAILLGLWTYRGDPPRAAAGVLVTAILMWAYMHAMQYIVIWAGDIPREAHWYLERGRHGWDLLAALFYGLQGLFAFGALLSPSVRSSRHAMMALAALTLVMRLAENAWFILPGMGGLGWAVAPLVLSASLAMLGFGWAGSFALRARAAGRSESGWARQMRSAP